VVLRWAKDQLELWSEAGFGWAMWNLRGAFGVVDTQRDDCAYEDFHSHKLDRQLLDLLKAH
jgi:endoglucanase